MYSVRLLLVNEPQRIWVLPYNAGSCVSSVTRMRRGNLVNAWQRLTQKRRNGQSSFFSFAHKTYSRNFITLRLNH